MHKQKAVLILLATFLIGLIISQSIVDTSNEFNINIEAEQAIYLTEPFEIINSPEASGGKSVWSTMRSDQLESYLEYEFNVNQNGKYRFWANCYWPGGCNNSFLIQIDDGNQYVFGNDQRTFKQWHWVKGPSIELTKGNHKLKLWNKEAFSSIDLMIFSKNSVYSPDHK